VNVFVSLLFLGIFLSLGFYYTARLEEEDQSLKLRPWFCAWAFKGALVPALVWAFFNLGIFMRMPPLMPEVDVARAQGNWLRGWAAVTAPALLIIGSYWAALTFGWLLSLAVPRLDHRRDFLWLTAVLSLILAPIACTMIYRQGWPTLGLGLTVWLLPLTHCSLWFVRRHNPVPAYSRAIAKMKFGKYSDAELEVIGELEKFKEDFDGWLMLAGLYANQFHDLASADETVCGLCEQPNISPVQVSLALHRLADWHLKLAGDLEGARHALEEICRRFPDSHVAMMARQRIAQLPLSAQELLDRQQVKTIPLPALCDNLEEPKEPGFAGINLDQAFGLAKRAVENLTSDPNDVAEREKFARILAEQLDRPEEAIEQLELLIKMPSQNPEKIPYWLSLIAAWHLTYQKDKRSGKQALRRLIEECPQSAEAFAAQRRLNLLEMEEAIHHRAAGRAHEKITNLMQEKW